MQTIGVIGGMGPMATLDFFKKIILLSDATCDQEYPHLIIDNNTKIPDRTSFILGHGENPTLALQSSALNLVRSGAKILAMPCNTAHYFYDAICASIEVEFPNEKVIFVNMIEEVVKTVQTKGVDKVLLLATDGTLKTNIYQNFFESAEIEVAVMDELSQSIIMKMIYDYKAGKRQFDKRFLRKIIESADAQGNVQVVLGCTELPLIFELTGLLDRVINPTEILARSVIALSI